MIATDSGFGDMTSAEDARSQNNNTDRGTRKNTDKVETCKMKEEVQEGCNIWNEETEENGVVLGTDAPTLDGPLFSSLSTGPILVPEWISMARVWCCLWVEHLPEKHRPEDLWWLGKWL